MTGLTTILCRIGVYALMLFSLAYALGVIGVIGDPVVPKPLGLEAAGPLLESPRI
jgi:hypothetical protein